MRIRRALRACSTRRTWWWPWRCSSPGATPRRRPYTSPSPTSPSPASPSSEGEGLHQVNKDQIAKWILSFQVHPEANSDLDNGQFYGFCGFRTTQYPSNSVNVPNLFSS